jgi:hypothetical protein
MDREIISLETHPEKWGLKVPPKPRQAKEYRPAPLEAVLQQLEAHLARYEADNPIEGPNTAKAPFMRGVEVGYIDGLKRAISIVQCEIGLRQDPPNINYPGERPQ